MAASRGEGGIPSPGTVEDRESLPASLNEPEALVSSLEAGGRLLGFRAVQFAFLFLLSLVAAKALGPTGRGQYALALNLATVVWVVSHLSVEHSIGRMLARREATLVELAHLAAFFALSLGLVGVICALAIGLPLRDSLLGDATALTVILAAATIPFTLVGQMAVALLLRIGALRPYGIIIAGGAIVQLALVLAIEVGTGLSPELAMLAALVTIALTAVALAVTLARRIGAAALTPRADRRLLRSALRIGLRLQPASVALWLNLKVDLLLVGILASTHEAGLYSLSANLAEIVFVSVATIGLAALETQTAAETDAAVSYTTGFIGQNLGVAIVLAVLASVVAYPFIVFVYGSEWEGSVVPFVLLMPAVIALGLEGPARDLLIRIAPPLSISAASSIALVANVGLNFLLVPRIGIAGASVASVVSYWLAGVLMLYLLSRHGNIPMKRTFAAPRPGAVLALLWRRGRAAVG